MSKFLTGTELEEKLTDIIWKAKLHVVIVSPFIKLDAHVRSIFEKIKHTHEVTLYLVFGKNEGYTQKSLNHQDFTFFKEFKNIAILYHSELHAKHYCNEKEGLITSLNLYDYSMINNIEYGVHFAKSILPSDKLFSETEVFTDELIFEMSEVVFLKKPVYKKKLMGLSKAYQSSRVLHDVSEDFFNGGKYKTKQLWEFEDNDLEDLEKSFGEKPKRIHPENKKGKKKEKKKKEKFENSSTGYCIRTGEQIPFNPEKPLSYNAFISWNEWGNVDYRENFCHKTGKESKGRTSMRNPIIPKYR